MKNIFVLIISLLYDECTQISIVAIYRKLFECQIELLFNLNKSIIFNELRNRKNKNAKMQRTTFWH